MLRLFLENYSVQCLVTSVNIRHTIPDCPLSEVNKLELFGIV